MKKANFIVGTVFFVISTLCCVFGNILILESIPLVNAENGQGLALIVTVPVALILCGAQLVSGLVAFGCYGGCWTSQSKTIKVLSIIFSALVGATVAFSAIAFAVLFAKSGSSSAALSVFDGLRF